MRAILPILFALLCSVQSFAQSLTVQPFEAITADSVKVEQLNDSVAVILTGEKPGKKTGAYLQVVSTSKWATPLLDGVNITQTKQPGEWILFAPAGKYRVLLAEFDPEFGPRYSFHDLIIGKPTGPTDPPVDPPPSGDFAALKAVAKSEAAKLNDPKTKQALLDAYKSIKPAATYDETVAATKAARRLALSARQGDSRSKDWSAWLIAVDVELQKAVKPGDTAAYVGAIKALVDALSE